MELKLHLQWRINRSYMVSKANVLHLKPDAIQFPLARSTSRFMIASAWKKLRRYLEICLRAWTGKKIVRNSRFLKSLFVFFFLTTSSEDRKNKVWIKIQITLKNDSRSCMKSKWRLRLVNQSCKLWGKSWSNVKGADGFRFNVEKNSLHTVCQSKKIMTKENTMTVTKYKMHLGSWKLTQHLCN